MEFEFFVVVTLSGLLATYLHLVMGQWAGQIAVFFNGVFFAFLYATVFGPYLPGEPIIRGFLFGFILYLGSGLFFIPVYLREGLFLSQLHARAWIPLLMVHLVYGLVVGWLSPILGYPAA